MNSTLRWIITIIGWIILLMIFGIWRSLDREIGTSAIMGGIRGTIFSGGIFLLYQWAKKGTSKATITKKENLYNNKINNKTTESIAREDKIIDTNTIYEKISEEIDNNSVDKGLWLKLFSENDGDIDKTKVQYIKERFKILKDKEITNFELITKKQEEAERKIFANPDLAHAVCNGDISKARYLLDNGIKPIGTDEHKNLLLEIATKNKDKLMIDLIKLYRKKINLTY